MKKIVAIGGGSIGFGAAKPEVTPISREILRLSGRKKPRLLFLPTASLDDPAYIRAVRAHFTKLGCEVEDLCLIGKDPGRSVIARKVRWADIVYVGGGNTLRMMLRWKKLGVDQLLMEAQRRGRVLCGSSAGALCWFRLGNSDSRKYRNPKAELIKVRGLGFIDALGCPHYDKEKDRKPQLKAMMRKTPGIAVALDNCAALEVVGERFRVLASRPSANAYRVRWLRGAFEHSRIPKDGKWRRLKDLTSGPVEGS